MPCRHSSSTAILLHASLNSKYSLSPPPQQLNPYLLRLHSPIVSSFQKRYPTPRKTWGGRHQSPADLKDAPFPFQRRPEKLDILLAAKDNQKERKARVVSFG